MSNARNLADIVTGNFDVPLGALDNVPPSNDASALTTGTLDTARLAYSPVNKAGDTMTGTLNVSSGNLSVSHTGVDGNYQKVLEGIYSGNTNERNTILSAVSSGGSGSGFKFMASDGGGSAGQKDVAYIKREGSVIQNHFYFYTRGHTETTATFGVQSGWTTFMEIQNVVVPSGYEGFIVFSGALAHNYEGGAGQFYWRMGAHGPTTIYTNDFSNGYGFHNNFNPGSTYTQGRTLPEGTYTLRLEAIRTQGSVTLTNYGGKNNFDYELWVRKV